MQLKSKVQQVLLWLSTNLSKAYMEKQKLGFPCGSVGKASAYNAGDPGSIPGSGGSPGEGNGYPLHILAWRIPWTEEPGELQSMGSKRVRHD